MWVSSGALGILQYDTMVVSGMDGWMDRFGGQETATEPFSNLFLLFSVMFWVWSGNELFPCKCEFGR